MKNEASFIYDRYNLISEDNLVSIPEVKSREELRKLMLQDRELVLSRKRPSLIKEELSYM